MVAARRGAPLRGKGQAAQPHRAGKTFLPAKHTMASSLLALLDDIATVLDDIALMTQMAARKGAAAADDVALLTKLSAQKTAGVLGDDLALNAQQVTGVMAHRELPVVWAVAKGSLLNKAILVPIALAVSALAPWAVTPLLMAGGAFLCFEGFEKLAHKLLHRAHADAPADDAHGHGPAATPAADAPADLAQMEKDKIKGAIRTDFILSAEIIAITLGTVAGKGLLAQLAVLAGISLLMTAGVYGLVAAIVKLDDAGLALSQRRSAAARALGQGILRLAPWLMKLLSVAGTAAMFLVGGGIIVHGWPWLHHLVQALMAAAGPLGWLAEMLGNAAAGMATGALALAALSLIRRLRGTAAA